MLHTMFISCFRTHTQLFMPQGSHFEVQILGVPSSPKSAVFLNIVQKGGGESNPCSKILEQNLYDFKGILAT